MNWQEACEHPDLQNLPFKIELNEYDKIVMSPVKIYHSFFQTRIAILLEGLLDNGYALSECAIKTTKGTKVADTAWASMAVWEKIKLETEASISPEICVEILSSSNTQKEMTEKRALYCAAGAKEVWLCNEQGEMSFFNSQHALIHSELVPDFPLKIVS
ncbi:MAG: Uma2 family endonuclease [Methyloprofundus sp.]|nr:Uma2 family endonuclease [Methyloprofundus sp.]